MPEKSARYYVSSAVIVARPSAEASVSAMLDAMENVEVFAAERGKIIVVIEGRTSGQLGATLSEISAMPGVVAANMVYEHAEDEEAIEDERRTNAA